MTDVPPLERRRIATEATIARFAGQPFAWGKNDCAKLAAFHLRQFGKSVGIAKAGQWDSALGARRALKRMGFEGLPELATANLAEISPASALLGDIVIIEQRAMDGNDGFDSLFIYTGNHSVLGWMEGFDTAVIARLTFAHTRAWRVLA